MSTSALAWLRRKAPRGRLLLAACASLGAVATPVAWGAIPSVGENVAPSGESGQSCPSPNPPNELTLAAGTPQTATLGSAFATNLQVTFANSNGCSLTAGVAGSAVTFSAPSAGASGLFSSSGSNSVTVGSDATGMAAAPQFTANDTAGGFTVIASSAYGSVQFSLRNAQAGNSSSCATAPAADTGLTSFAGTPTRLTTGVGTTQAATEGARFPIHLAVTVTDAQKTPVPGVLVTFAAPNRGPSGYFTVRSGGAHTTGSHTPGSRAPRLSQVEVRTDACGIALAPTFTANHRAGWYIVVASFEHLKAAFALVNRGS